jgi:hypothetical protein
MLKNQIEIWPAKCLEMFQRFLGSDNRFQVKDFSNFIINNDISLYNFPIAIKEVFTPQYFAYVLKASLITTLSKTQL